MRHAVLLALAGLCLWGCTMYSRGERYYCFSLSEATHRCKQPPYHFDSRTKDDAVTPP